MTSLRKMVNSHCYDVILPTRMRKFTHVLIQYERATGNELFLFDFSSHYRIYIAKYIFTVETISLEIWERSLYVLTCETVTSCFRPWLSSRLRRSRA